MLDIPTAQNVPVFRTCSIRHVCIFIGPNDEEHYMRLAFYQGANSIQLIMTLTQ